MDHFTIAADETAEAAEATDAIIDVSDELPQQAHRMFAAAAAPVDAPEQFQPLDMNDPLAIANEQMEDPELVQHMIDARLRLVEEEQKRYDASELKGFDVDNRKLLTELSTLVNELKVEVNDFFAHLGGPNFAREYDRREKLMMENLKKSIQKVNLLQTGYNKVVGALYE